MPYANGQQISVGNTKGSENSQTVALGCVYRTSISIKWLRKIPACSINSIKLEGYSERAMNNCSSSLGRPQSGHAMLSPFFQPRYSTGLNEKSINLLPTFSRCAAVNYYTTLYSVREMGITRLLCYSTVPQRKFENFCCAQLHWIEYNMPGTNFSIKQLRGTVTSTGSGDRSNYPILKACGASNLIQQ